MTIKDYFKKNIHNCLLNGEYIDFEELYKKYKNIKELGTNLLNDHDISKNRIRINDNTITIPEIFINNVTENDYINYINSNSSDITKMQLNLAVLSSILSKVLKAFKNKGIYIDFYSEFKKLFIIESSATLEYEQFVEKLPTAIEEFGLKNNLYDFSERLRTYDKTDRLENYLNFKDEQSLLFHLLNIEIVYYSNQICYSANPPKPCIDCHEPNYTKTDLCEKCNKKRINDRRKANAKCKRLRNKLHFYIHKYSDEIPTNIRMNTERMLEDSSENKYTDLNELIRLKQAIEKELNN